MPPSVQVPAGIRICLVPRISGGLAVILALFLAGCAGKIDAASLGIDDSIRTGSVQPAASTPDPETGSDAMTIRNAVTSADLPALEGRPLAWANAETGASGSVSQISEIAAAGTPCRRFLASRQNFEGIMLYRGEACLRERGHWQLRQFQSIEPNPDEAGGGTGN